MSAAFLPNILLTVEGGEGFVKIKIGSTHVYSFYYLPRFGPNKFLNLLLELGTGIRSSVDPSDTVIIGVIYL